MQLIQGDKIAKRIIDSLRKEILGLKGRPPGLGFIQVGEDSASKTYVKMKKKRCQEVGIISKDFELKATVSEEELKNIVLELNFDPAIDGILLQMPLPHPLNASYFLSLIDPKKDVDGFHPLNMGYLLLGEFEGFIPCTPYGIFLLLRESGIDPSGKHVVILGRSNIVGKPLSALLMQKHKGANATVTVAHSKSHNLETLCKSADILIAAIGKKEWINERFLKPGAVVIDVGINRTATGKITGDVDFAKVAPLASAITPVPRGVGPMTIAMLLTNTYLSYLKREKTINPKHLQFVDNILVSF